MALTKIFKDRTGQKFLIPLSNPALRVAFFWFNISAALLTMAVAKQSPAKPIVAVWPGQATPKLKWQSNLKCHAEIDYRYF